MLCNSKNEEYQEIRFLWNNIMRTMTITMFQDENNKLIFQITANVPRFELQEIAIKGSSNPDIMELDYIEIPGGFGDNGIRVFRSDVPIHDIVQIIYLYFEA